MDWRKEFGVEGFELPPRVLLAMCEEIYIARVKRLKYGDTTSSRSMLLRTNDAINTARAEMDRKIVREEEMKPVVNGPARNK